MAIEAVKKNLHVKDYNSVALENRWGDRQTVYLGDMPEVNVIVAGQIELLSANIVDLSAEGIGLCHSAFSPDMVGNKIEISLSVESKHKIHGRICNFDRSQFAGRVENRVGVAFETESRIQNLRPKRFPCPKHFQALAYGDYPFKYNHTAYYQVIDFAFNGMTLLGTSASDLLVPGLELKLSIVLPVQGTFMVDIQVTGIRSLDSEKFYIGCTFINADPIFLRGIATYLLANQDVNFSTDELRENGFLVSDVGDYARFGYVSNNEEWKELLHLRLVAAHAEGRWLDSNDPYDLVDDFDKYSRHLYCKIGNRMLATARINFNNGDPKRCEHYQYIDIPKFLFKGGFIEASRVCTFPGFRGANLFAMIVRHCFRIAAQSNCRYGLINCEDSLVKIYRRFGGIPLNKSFTNEYMKGKRLNVLYFDLQKVFYGRSISPTMWYLFHREMHDYLLKRGIIKPNLMQRMQVFFLRRIVGCYITKVMSKSAQNQLLRRDESLATLYAKGKNID